MPRPLSFRVESRDVPAHVAAKRLGLEAAEFTAALPKLIQRGFPRADPDTGNFDLHAIERWCNARHAHLFGDGSAMQAIDANTVAKDRIETMRRGAS